MSSLHLLRSRTSDDRGVVAGSDMLLFGFLVFVLTSLVIVNVWTVIDASLAVSSAAREGARTYVEADPNTAWAEAQIRMDDVMADYGRTSRAVPPSRPTIATYERCAVVTITAEYDVALISLPLFGDFGSLTRIDASHSERIDAYRSGDFEGSC
jgi:hypothetical protein